MSITLADPGPPNPEFERAAGRDRLEAVVQTLVERGVRAQIAGSGAHARQLVLDAVPQGSEVHTALSETVRELGLAAEFDESGRYDSVRAKLNQLDRETQDRERRKLGAAPDYIVGSVHAVTDAGELVIGSGSGSQLGAYAYAAAHVILVVGHHKLVANLDDGLRRVREYSLPREHVRMQAAGYAGSLLAKTLIIEREPRGRIQLIFVPETLGF